MNPATLSEQIARKNRLSITKKATMKPTKKPTMKPTMKHAMAALLACAINSQAALVAHFTFDTDLKDSEGTVNTLHYNGDGGTTANVSLTADGRMAITNPQSTSDTTKIDYLSTDYTPGDSGSFAFWYEASSLYNYNTIFSNTVDSNDWEMWTYSNGETKARVNGLSADSVTGTTAGENHHYAFTWEHGAGNYVKVQLYRDGEKIGPDIDAFDWVGPGALLIGGGGGNHGGNGIYDDFRIYDHVLTSAEVQALLVPEPSSVALLGLGGVALLLRRRK